MDNALGFALGVMFVNETFDEKTKPEAEKMIRLVTKAFRWNSVKITLIGLRINQKITNKKNNKLRS